jgi:hypothetical protein
MPAKDTVSILDGSIFVVSEARGDIDAGPESPHGLFHRDTGLEPDGDELRIDAPVPEAIGDVELRGIPGRWGRVDAVAGGVFARPLGERRSTETTKGARCPERGPVSRTRSSTRP